MTLDITVTDMFCGTGGTPNVVIQAGVRFKQLGNAVMSPAMKPFIERVLVSLAERGDKSNAYS